MFIRETRGASLAVLALLVGLSTSSLAHAQGGTHLPEGVQPEAPKGFYVETQLGAFVGFGGAFGGSRAYSNAQPFVGLSAGFDIKAVKGLSAFLGVGFGANQGVCLDFDEAAGGCVAYNNEVPGQSLTAFSLIPIELGARYAFVEFVPRFTMHAALGVGYTLITPSPSPTTPLGSAHVGLGVGIDYATQLAGLAVGVEVMGRMAFTPMYPSVSIYPRLRYVF